MTNTQDTAVTADRVKLPFTFDVGKIQADLQRLGFRHFHYYDPVPLRSPAHMVDTTLPLPPPAEDYADGSWTDWLPTPALQQSPYLTEMVKFFQQHTRVTLVRILRLAPGAEVQEHTDPTLGLHIERSVIRLTIPVQVHQDVTFYLNGTPVPMAPGECWYLNLTDPHRITNNSPEERINITIDMAPNEWIRTVIAEAVNQG